MAQPRLTFAGEDLYPSLADKAVALGYSLIKNPPFIDGNKRIGHGAMDAMLILNGFELVASVNDAEMEILAVAAGQRKREDLLRWVESRIQPLQSPH